jgi:hypothetical protein
MNSLADRKWGAAALLVATVATLVTLGTLGTPARANAQNSSASIQPPPGTVTLPLAEYNRLLDRSTATIAGREDPPVPAVISRAEIDLRVNNGAARATIGLTGEVFRSGPTDVPLISGGTLIDAQLTSSTPTATRPPGSAAPRGGAQGDEGGRTLPLVYANGRYKAILPGSASFTLALTWGTTTLTEPGRAGLMLPAVHAGSVRASIDLPGEIADVRMQNGAITSRSVNAGRTRIEMTLDPGKATLVSWSSRETNDQAVRREVRLLSDAKTILTIGEADERLATLFDVTVVQGDPTRLDVRVPAGFELTSVSGPSVEEAAVRDGVVSLTVREPARRRHQFLITFERAIGSAASVTAASTVDSVSVGASVGASGPASEAPAIAQAVPAARQVPLPWLDGVQREMGEVAIEGVGTMELAAEEKGALHRIDASELNATLQTMAREAVLAAFKYQRRTPDAVMVDLKVTRFPESAVLAAVADRAVVTTLVTHQGRALTEVTMHVRNQGQPFMKVGLPQGATLLSAEVAGVSVKPVLGSDGARVPLLRPGFRPPGGGPNGPSGGGSYQVSFVYLESGEAFAKKGDARLTLARVDLPISLLEWELFLPEGFQVKRFEGDVLPQQLVASTLMPVLPDGVIGGVAGGVPGGIATTSPRQDAARDKPGALNETIIVEERNRPGAPLPPPPPPATAQQAQSNVGSVNVQNLQRKISGVLPVRIDVPRAGHSHMFVRPVVIDEDTTVRFTYRARS